MTPISLDELLKLQAAERVEIAPSPPSLPSAIYFRALHEEAVVLAVMHGRRHPRRWRSRR